MQLVFIEPTATLSALRSHAKYAGGGSKRRSETTTSGRISYGSVFWVCEVVSAFAIGEALIVESASDLVPECVDGPCGSPSEQMFEIGQELFDEIEVWTVGRQEEHFCSGFGGRTLWDVHHDMALLLYRLRFSGRNRRIAVTQIAEDDCNQKKCGDVAEKVSHLATIADRLNCHERPMDHTRPDGG